MENGYDGEESGKDSIDRFYINRTLFWHNFHGLCN